jgi:hypothetical protein
MLNPYFKTAILFIACSTTCQSSKKQERMPDNIVEQYRQAKMDCCLVRNLKPCVLGPPGEQVVPREDDGEKNEEDGGIEEHAERVAGI